MEDFNAIEESGGRIVRPMRKRADWMTRLDDEILERIENDGAGTPIAVAESLGRNNDYVGQRCRKLVVAGLLAKPSTGFYKITDDGRAYLAGELDASDLPVPE